MAPSDVEAKDVKKEKSDRKEKTKHSHREKDRSKDKHRDKDRDREKRGKDDEHIAKAAAQQAEAVNGNSAPSASSMAEAPEQQATPDQAARRGDKDSSRSRHDDDGRRHKEKQRDRDRGKEKERGKDRGREKAREKDGDRDKEKDRELPGPPPAPPAAAAPAAADAPQPAAEDSVRGQVNESGGEISMSIEETNRVRIALGLKPLALENDADKRKKEAQAREAQRAEEAKAAKAAELAERVKAHREKRVEDEKMRKVKTLGQAEPEVDDLAAWVNKSRTLEEKARAEAREKALRQARALEQQDDDFEASDEEDEMGRPLTNAKELAGMKVRHEADELGEGETMILTLADRNILDEAGGLDDDAPDELENALVIEQKKRERARRAARKEARPGFDEEEGAKPRGMLNKYDEEEEDAGLRIDEAGQASNAAQAAKQAEIRARLAAAENAAGPSQQVAYNGRSEYYTQDEMSQMFKPKAKKKKKKLRKKDTAEELAFLEEEAAAAGGNATDHGSRAARATLADTRTAERDQAAALKQQRYDAALQKANYASLALQEEAGAAGEDEEDEELYATLARARRTAQARSTEAEAAEKLTLDRVVEDARRRREAEEARAAREAAEGSDMAFTEAAEFARSIQVAAPEEDPLAASAAATASGAASVAPIKAEAPSSSHMGVDDEEPAPTPAPAPKQDPDAAPAAWGNWVSAEDAARAAAGAAAEDVEMADAREDDEEEEDATEAPETREKPVGKGLAGCLALLKDRGELSEQVEWSGRTTDIVAAQRLIQEGQLRDVYTGGRQESAVAANIERALTQRDEFGRIMTPKERFRVLNYGFHGIDPSRNKKDKKFRKVAEDQERKRRAMSEASAASSFSRMQAVQAATATPYLVLSGKVQPGQSSDPASGYATVEREPVALTPVLGGGQTPLTGVRKVEAMLGVKRPPPAGAGSMAPPPPRKPRNA